MNLHPDNLPGRNRDWAARPYQGNGRSGQGYGRTGRVEIDLWPERDTRPSCEAVQSAPLRHFALVGIALGVLITIGLLGMAGVG